MLYIDSKGREHDPETMAFPHLNSTVEKMAREGRVDDYYEALKAIRDERKRRWEAENPQG